MHVPQSIEAAIELMEIAAVPKQLISPRLCKPLVTVVQDTLVGVNRLTRPTEFFTRREYMNLLVHSKRWDGRIPPPAKTDPVPLWSGLQVVSALLPTVHLARGNKMWDESKGKADPNYVVINNGTIENGILDGDIFDKELIHVLYNDFSPEVTVDFLDSLQAVVATYLQNSGFSVGLSDLIADSGTLGEIATNINQLKDKIESLQLQVHMGLFDNTSGRTNQDEFESKVFNILNEVIGAAGQTGLKSLAANNRMVNMVKCGSKGSDLNIAQMIAVLGQQSIEGKRIAYGFQDRTLPHFKRYEDGADSRGFIESSFVKGLSPSEFFFHAMTGREGLIDTAVKSVTGDTMVYVMEKGSWITVAIGPWIDGWMTKFARSVQHSQPSNLELLPLQGDLFIWTADENGTPSIGTITAMTRHDPGDTLYKITTTGGASVTVSANKSLCIYNNAGKLMECAPCDVCVGNEVCVLANTGEYTSHRESITSIEVIPVSDPTMRLYDLTVPSTLNFAIANGLVVRDTADSGYIQRQLVKTMEDLTVFYDGSVRDSGGLIVQFAYGDDGTSATKIENQPIGLAKMSDTDVRAKFTVQGVSADRSQKHLAKVFEDRDMLVKNVWNGRADKMVQCAVHLPRLIEDTIQQLGLKKEQGQNQGAGVPVTSDHVLDTIDTILQRTRPDNRLWAALLRFHLNPADLQKQGFTRAAFDWLTEQIIVRHMKSWVVPGEMAGIIAAQSLGEPTTQMSSGKETWISVKNLKDETRNFTGKVGVFIDNLMTENEEATFHKDDSSYLNLPPEWAIMGVSDDEKASWKTISQLSRHPANGGMVRVKTKSGRSTTATLTHSFLKRTPNGIAEVKGSDLRLGNRIPVAFRMPEAPNPLVSFEGFALTKDFGWLVGIYLADGCFSGNTVKITKIHPVVEQKIRALADIYGWKITVRNYAGAYGPGKDTIIHSEELKDVLMTLGDTGSFDKVINAPIHHANKAFIAGVLSGYFDGDGNINVTRQQIRVCSRSEELIRGIARLLSFCGVFGTICQETSIRMPDMVMHTLNVIRKHAARFQSEIGLSLPEKAAALEQIVAYNTREDAHSQKEELDKIPELGDIIAQTGKLLKMPGQSRTYGRWASSKGKDSIGRRTLENYVRDFKEMMAVHVDKAVENQVKINVSILESALNSDIIWDEIVGIDILPDPMEMVYDFTVPGNDSFMVDDNIFVHNTLNTFHLSGVAAKSGMTRGVPRLKELLKVTQNPRATSLTIFLRPDIRKSKEDARRVTQELEFTTLKDLVTVSRIYYDPHDSDTLITQDKEWLAFYSAFEMNAPEQSSHSPWILRLELDRERMFNKNINMEDINYILSTAFNGELYSTYTDHNAQQLIFRIRIRFKQDSLDDLQSIKQFQFKILTSVVVRGLPGLQSVSFRKVSDEYYEKNPANDNKFEPVEQFVLDTLGTNFLDVMIHSDVDGSRLVSNHVHDINENLGIEAARAILFKEIFGLFESAAPVNYRHVSILCDTITNRGRLMSADRIGVNKKQKTGPLAKASFEQAEDIMLRAALFGELDAVTGVSANIMTGQPIRGGTSFAHVLLDEDLMMEYIAEAPDSAIERAPILSEERMDTILQEEDGTGCRQADLRIPVALPPAPMPGGPEELPELDIVLIDE